MRDHHAKKIFAENLRSAIAHARITQTELARRTRLSRDAISTYVNERSLPSHESLEKMARVLKTKAAALLPDRRRTDNSNTVSVTNDGSGSGSLLEVRLRGLPPNVLQRVLDLLRPYCPMLCGFMLIVG